MNYRSHQLAVGLYTLNLSLEYKVVPVCASCFWVWNKASAALGSCQSTMPNAPYCKAVSTTSVFFYSTLLSTFPGNRSFRLAVP